MPLSKIQTDILGLLASQRDPESYVAEATPLNRNAPRYSADIDIFHDREERVASAAMKDTATLEGAGYQVKWLRQLPVVYAAAVTRHDGATRLEWLADSDFRFFPTIPDATLGCAEPWTTPKHLPPGCQPAKWDCCICGAAKWYSPTPTGWRTIKRMRGGDAASGRVIPRSPPPCSSARPRKKPTEWTNKATGVLKR